MVPEAEHEEAAAHTEGLDKEVARLIERESIERVNLTGALGRSPQIAIVGAAGSGKSTLLQWAGLATTRAFLKQKLSTEQKDFMKALGDKPLVPFLCPLRDFNRYCEVHKLNRTARSLLQFLSVHIAEQHPTLDLPEEFVESQLQQGCLLMFDGVDEVAPKDRMRVREAIEGPVAEFHAHDRDRYLATSRTVAYFGGAALAGFRKCTVLPLAPDDRDTLIHLWYHAVLPRDKATREAEDLCRRIGASNKRVQDLAVTPLMTTIFALVHSIFSKRWLVAVGFWRNTTACMVFTPTGPSGSSSRGAISLRSLEMKSSVTFYRST